MSAIHHAHDQSALLTSWTGRNLRRYVSFIIIPKNTLMKFKIGYAAPQSSSTPNKVVETRPGGGMQMRLKYLPAGAIILTEPIIESKKIEGKGTYFLPAILKAAIENYNKRNEGAKLPDHLILDDLTFVNDKEYVEHSFDAVE